MDDRADLNDIVAHQDRGADLTIKHPVTGEATDVVLTIVGPDSETARRARLHYEDELFAFRGRPPASEVERMYLDKLARLVVRGNLGDGVAFTHSNVVRFLTEHNYAREQVDAFSQSRVPYFLKVTS
jgi:hypothetical protein